MKRREALALLAGLAAVNAARTSAAPASTVPRANELTQILPFTAGDVLAGCTELNNPQDDHAGRGRIMHYDGALQLKNTIWLNDTTHIVQGVRFGPDRSLWAFDTFAYKIIRIGANGRRLPNFTAPARGFALIAFASDGGFYLGENYVGDHSRVPLHTTLPFMPGTKRYGDGHLFKFDRHGRFVKEYATRVHGGMGGFQGFTACALTRDRKSVVYTSESGPKIFHYDLQNDHQLPDVVAFEDNTGHFFFDVAFDAAGRLLVVRGTGVDALELATGKVLQTYELKSFGWASLSTPTTEHFYVTNFFSGEIAKVDLHNGQILASANSGARKALSGVAECPA